MQPTEQIAQKFFRPAGRTFGLLLSLGLMAAMGCTTPGSIVGEGPAAWRPLRESAISRPCITQGTTVYGTVSSSEEEQTEPDSQRGPTPPRGVPAPTSIPGVKADLATVKSLIDGEPSPAEKNTEVMQAQAQVGVPPMAPAKPALRDVKESPFVETTVEPGHLVEIYQGIPRILILKQIPKRVQIGGDDKSGIVSVTVVTEREISLLGKKVGRTSLNLWFADPKDDAKQQIVSYLVHVKPDPETKKKLSSSEIQERYYRDIEAKINQNFPNSRVCLKLIGNKLLVTGAAHDAEEATQILKIVGLKRETIQLDNVQTTIVEHGLAESRITTFPGLDRPDDNEESEVPEGVTEVALQGEKVEAKRPVTTAPFVPALNVPGTEKKGANKANEKLQAVEVINMLRVPGEQQVMLKVVVAEVNRTAIRNLGTTFTIGNSKGLVFSSTVAGVPLVNGGQQNPFNINALFDQGKISLAMRVLKEMKLARSLAEPNLVTINGKPASFHAGGSFPIPVVSGFTASGLQSVQFIPVGVKLNFTPTVTDKDRVQLALNAEVSTRDENTVNVSGSQVPANLTERRFQSTVEMREGQTLAIAGLIQSNYGGSGKRVPWIGELPGVGRLFADDRISSGEQELIVLVTPVLIHPAWEHQRQGLPGEEILEPNDSEFYFHGRLESHRPNDFRGPIRTDIHRTHQNRHEGPSMPPGYDSR